MLIQVWVLDAILKHLSFMMLCRLTKYQVTLSFNSLRSIVFMVETFNSHQLDLNFPFSFLFDFFFMYFFILFYIFILFFVQVKAC